MTAFPHVKAPPSPPGHPLWGHLLDFRRNRPERVVELSRQYGGMVLLRSLISSDIIITEPKYVQHVLIDNRANYENMSFDLAALKDLFGDGLLLSDGEEWGRRRRMLQPILNRERSLRWAPIILRYIAALIERFAEAARRGAPVDVTFEMRRLALLTAGHMSFGEDISADADTIQACFDVAQERGELDGHPFSLAFAALPTRLNREYRQKIKQFNDLCYRQIAKHRQLVATSPPDEERDILSQFIQARDEQGQGLSDSALRGELASNLFDGSASVGDSVSWVWWFLDQHPEAWQSLHAELREVLGNRTPTVEDLPRLPFGRMCYQEALRLYPPAYVVSRHAVQADEVDGYHIPAHSNIVIPVYGVHRNPNVWPDPDAFDPRRFEDARSAGRHKLAFIPFGAGPRMCIGYQLSMMQAQIMIAAIAQRFRLRAVPGCKPVVRHLMTLQPQYGLMMHPEPLPMN